MITTDQSTLILKSPQKSEMHLLYVWSTPLKYQRIDCPTNWPTLLS